MAARLDDLDELPHVIWRLRRVPRFATDLNPLYAVKKINGGIIPAKDIDEATEGATAMRLSCMVQLGQSFTFQPLPFVQRVNIDRRIAPHDVLWG